MTYEQIFSLIGKILAYGGGTVAIAYLLFQYLAKKWIDSYFVNSLERFRHMQDQELEHYRFEINSLFNRITKIHEKEFEVLPEAWNKLVHASGDVIDTISLFQNFTNLSYLSEIEIDQLLVQYNLSQFQKDEIKNSHNKNEAFQKMVGRSKLINARNKVAALHNYLIYFKIFLSKELYDNFNSADKLFNKILDEYELSQTPGENYNGQKFFSNRDEIIAIIEEISSMIQQRLHYDEAE